MSESNLPQSSSKAPESYQMTPTYAQAFMLWLKIGLLSFGGPAAQIALMHREIVEQRAWLSHQQFFNALSFCMLLPGPEAMQLATYNGWRLHGTFGGMIAGLCFVLPGAALVLGFSFLYAHFSDLNFVSAAFDGVKAAVVVIVVQALLKLSRRALQSFESWVVALLAFVAIFFFNVAFPLIIIIVAMYGFITVRGANETVVEGVEWPKMLPQSFAVLLVWLFIWSIPFILILFFSQQAFLLELATFFSRLATVTFGGAYAVLAYLAQDVVLELEWLSTKEMIDGLGMAETTPGPLILVTEFVAYMAGHHKGGVSLGLLAAVITLWVTFVPCFLWIFVAAPYVDWICAQPRLKNALQLITAAVVGVILNLSVWFALHVFFQQVSHHDVSGIYALWVPEWASLKLPVLALTMVSAGLVLYFDWSMLKLLSFSMLGGLVLAWFF